MDKPKCLIVIITLMIYVCAVCARKVKPRTYVSDEEYIQMPDLFHLDKYDECIALKSNGLYCSAVIQLSPLKENSTIWNIIQKVIDNPYNYRHDRLRYGICLPVSCPQIPAAHYRVGFNDTRLMKTLSHCYSEKFLALGLRGTVESLQCESDEPFFRVSTSAHVFLGFIVTLLITIIVCTYYEGRARYYSDEEYLKIMDNKVGRLMTCFSISNNWRRLRQETQSEDAKRLSFIQGIRFFNMFFVIMSHTALTSFSGPIQNPRFLETTTDRIENMFLMNGSHIVQTNLAITGWLLIYNFFKTFEKRGSVTTGELVMIFINRYIRITPTLFLYMWFNATWLPFVNKGPNWIRLVRDEQIACGSEWWAFVLQINNYVFNKHMCMQHTWYLACDTQLFIIALIVLPVILKYKKYAVEILSGVVALGILVSFVVVYYLDLDILIRNSPEATYDSYINIKEWHHTLTPFHINLSGYFLGMLFGYWFYTNASFLKIFQSKIAVAFWYVLVYVPAISMIMIAFLFYQDGFEFSRVDVALNHSLSRVIFVFSVLLLCLGLSQKIGWFELWLLEWSPLQVLGRISFTAYIIHTSMLRFRQGIIRTPYFASSYAIMSDTIADFTISYLVATVTCLCIELPISALQNLISKKHSSQSKIEKKE